MGQQGTQSFGGRYCGLPLWTGLLTCKYYKDVHCVNIPGWGVGWESNKGKKKKKEVRKMFQ